MDLMAGATVFAQIVSLMGTFTSERSFGRIEQNQDFLTWLETTHHQELRQLLQANSQAMQSIQSLLNGNQEVLLARSCPACRWNWACGRVTDSDSMRRPPACQAARPSR
jgi:hypothetical protein